VLRLIAAVGSFFTDRAVERRLPAWAQRPKPKPLPAWFRVTANVYVAFSLWIWT
jgi:hypothetical protein